jgi:hypothetical protein
MPIPQYSAAVSAGIARGQRSDINVILTARRSVPELPGRRIGLVVRESQAKHFASGKLAREAQDHGPRLVVDQDYAQDDEIQRRLLVASSLHGVTLSHP